VVSNEYYISFHFAHFIILFIALIFVLQATLLILLLSRRKDTLLIYAAHSSDFLINEYEKLKSRPIRLFLFNKFPLFFNFFPLREKIEFKIIQAYFIRNFNLPAEFKFGNYTTQVLKNYVVELLDVRPIHWIFLSVLVFLNYVRIKVLDTDNIYCANNEGDTTRRYLAGSSNNVLPPLECIEYILQYIVILLALSTVFVFLILFLSTYYMQRLLDKVLDLEIELETKEDEEDEEKERAYDLWLYANNLECLEAGGKHKLERRLSLIETVDFDHYQESLFSQLFCMSKRRGLYVKCLDRIRSFEVERQSELIREDNHLSPKHRNSLDFSSNSSSHTSESQRKLSHDPPTPVSTSARPTSASFDIGNSNRPGLTRVDSGRLSFRSMRSDSVSNIGRQRKNTHIGGTHNAEHITVDTIRKNAVALQKKRDSAEDSSLFDLNSDESNIFVSCFESFVNKIGRLWDSDFHRDKSSEEKLENVFNITSPASYYNLVEFSLLLQCVYISLWATNFAGLASHSPSNWKWQVVLVIPALINFISLAKILEFACILKSVSVLDIAVSNKICESAFNDRIILQRLRKLIRSTLKELDLDHNMWRPFIEEIFEEFANEKSRFSIVDEQSLMDKDNFDLFLHSLQIRIPKDKIEEIFNAIDYDESNFLNWTEISSIIFPDFHDKGISTVKRKHRKKHDHYYTRDSIKEFERMSKRISSKSKEYDAVIQEEDEISDVPTLNLPSQLSLSPLTTLSNVVEEIDENVDIELVELKINREGIEYSSGSSSSSYDSDSSSSLSDTDEDVEDYEINDINIKESSYDPTYVDI
jgi:hypothetical protein